MNDLDKKYPEGHFLQMWMGIGIAIFSGLGIPLSITTENPGFIAIGPAIGVSVGLAIGQSIENKYKQDGRIRPLTEIEQKRKKTAVLLGVVTFTLGILLFLLLNIL